MAIAGEDKKIMATRGLSVTRTIRESILSGEFGGGARLNEVDLATALGVSRTPIRAAFRRSRPKACSPTRRTAAMW